MSLRKQDWISRLCDVNDFKAHRFARVLAREENFKALAKRTGRNVIDGEHGVGFYMQVSY